MVGLTMTSSWVAFDLRREGIDFVAEHLWAAPEYPMRQALAELDLRAGHVWTWAPVGTRLTRQDLTDGIPEGMDQGTARAEALRFIERYLESGERLVLLEDYEASPSDPWLSKEAEIPRERLSSGKRLYWYATLAGQVEPLLRWGCGLGCCLVLTSSVLGLVARDELSRQEVIGAASRTDHFLIDAFDFEGYVVWSRQ